VCANHVQALCCAHKRSPERSRWVRYTRTSNSSWW
jgi:hypothetical protein